MNAYKPFHVAIRLAAPALVACILGCDRPRIDKISDNPIFQQLDVLSVIESDAFIPSGIVATSSCTIWAVGSSWGLVVEIDLQSGKSQAIGQIPTRPRDARLEPGVGSRVLVWSEASRLLGWLDTRSATFREVDPPKHPWEGLAVGPPVVLSDTRVAIAPIGGRSIVRSPRPWRDAWLVYIVDDKGRVIRGLRRIRDMGGRYISAAASQVRLGRRADTLLVAHLFDGRIDIFPAETQPGIPSPASLQLPQYFRAPRPWEDIWEATWLINGTQPRVYIVPQVAEAAFTPNGRLFAVRNGFARWNDDDNPIGRRMYKRPGGWHITQQWLEEYATDGSRLGAYSLPVTRATRLVANGMGLVFVWDGNGTVFVIRDPNATGECTTLPSVIRVPYEDSPYAKPLSPLESDDLGLAPIRETISP